MITASVVARAGLRQKQTVGNALEVSMGFDKKSPLWKKCVCLFFLNFIHFLLSDIFLRQILEICPHTIAARVKLANN